MAALTAAELKYPDVPNAPSWLSLAQGVFNDQVARWDTTTCQGGLRWQIYPYQGGYTIKNAISNGGLFQISARLARFTGNQTYADWAQKIWDWSSTTPLLENSDWHIADTTSISADCKDHGDIQWTYNYGAYLMGAAYMYNMVRLVSALVVDCREMGANGDQTNADPKWKAAIDGLLGTSFSTFFPSQYGSNTMSEIACETINTCDRNQICFKGFLSSWMATTAQLVPYTEAEILPKLQASAVAAGKQCSGEGNTALCGIQWYNPTWDGTQGLEQQMAALNVFSSNLVAFQAGGSTSGSSSYTPPTKPAPVTASTGGNSTSDPNAGSASGSNFAPPPRAITTGDRAGAGIVTVIFAGGWLGMIAWMVTGA
jgi:mannan endo-1,6-alpha-mannosidase